MRQLIQWVGLGTVACVFASIVGLILIACTHDADITPVVVTALVGIASGSIGALVTAVVHYISTGDTTTSATAPSGPESAPSGPANTPAGA